MTARKQSFKGARTRPPCKRPGCDRPARAHQVYCSIECSPYGNLPDSRWEFSKKKLGSCGCFHLDPEVCASIQELQPLRLVAARGDTCPCPLHQEPMHYAQKKK